MLCDSVKLFEGWRERERGLTALAVHRMDFNSLRSIMLLNKPSRET